jgi:hypothetical protein
MEVALVSFISELVSGGFQSKMGMALFCEQYIFPRNSKVLPLSQMEGYQDTGRRALVNTKNVRVAHSDWWKWSLVLKYSHDSILHL